MSLKCGIVGLPNVGKSTLFNCVSSGKAQSANFPFCTIEPNLGSTNVPDKRLEVLSDICKPQRTIPATVDIVDIAGLVKGASRGEGLGNQFLANIRECDAILHVLRCFDDGNIVHVDGSVDPVRDKEVVDTELQIKDLETVEARLSKCEKAGKAGDKEAAKLAALLTRYRAALVEGRSCRSVALINDEEAEMARNLFLLTNKPVMYVCNVDEAHAASGNAYVEAVREAVKDENAEILVIAAKTESDIAEIEDYDDRQMFLADMGLEESGVVRLIQGAYRLLGLQTFFTAGSDECRAWTIHKGDKAPRAAGVIHTDFERGFIRAEVIKYDDFVAYKTEAAVRAAGKMGVEGKDYVVQDGDIMHFLFNV
ncbi:MAG: redox-regulated ATPase YchF [Bacteroidales bacterium]|nr:redox-regulated ATPase YchF [Candidatus Cryptobacteroides aphodequi]